MNHPTDTTQLDNLRLLIPTAPDSKRDALITEYTRALIPWERKVNATARRTGYTASLVLRRGQHTITIAEREGDRVIYRKRGKSGMYTGPEY